MTQAELKNIFMPFSLIRHKTDGKLYVVAGNYTLMYGAHNGGCNFGLINVYDLDDDMNVVNEHAWEDASEFDLVDDTHPREMYDKVLLYLQRIYNHPFKL